jgi:predicted lactoylglutathione lyase
LFEVVLANADNAEARFKDIVQACVKTKDKQQEILHKTLTFRQKINKFGAEVSANGGAVQMLTAAAGLL